MMLLSLPSPIALSFANCSIQSLQKWQSRTSAPICPRFQCWTVWYSCAVSGKTQVSDRDERRSNCTRIISWNVASLRALLRKDPEALQKLVKNEQPDLLCLQETKLQESHEKVFMNILDDLPCAVFNSSQTRLGYSGTAMYARNAPRFMQKVIQHEVGDGEGRLIMLIYAGVCVVNVYTVNSGNELRRLDMRLSWDAAFRKFARDLRESIGKPVVVMGDFNVAHRDEDVYDPNKVHGVAGFTTEERESFNDLLETGGFVDAFRLLHPHDTGRFTFWDYRTRARRYNRGWRIDYALISDDMVDAVRDVRILDHVTGSDHCPIAIDLALGILN